MSAQDDDKTAPTSGGSALDDVVLSQRLQRLSQSLHQRQEKEAESVRQSTPSDNSGFARAFRLSADFMGGVIAGGLLGWLIDRFAGTSPFGLLVFVLLGFAAGTLNVIRTSQASMPVTPSDNTPNSDAERRS